MLKFLFSCELCPFYSKFCAFVEFKVSATAGGSSPGRFLKQTAESSLMRMNLILLNFLHSDRDRETRNSFLLFLITYKSVGDEFQKRKIPKLVFWMAFSKFFGKRQERNTSLLIILQYLGFLTGTFTISYWFLHSMILRRPVSSYCKVISSYYEVVSSYYKWYLHTIRWFLHTINSFFIL